MEHVEYSSLWYLLISIIILVQVNDVPKHFQIRYHFVIIFTFIFQGVVLKACMEQFGIYKLL